MTTRKRQAVTVGCCIVLCAALILTALFQGMPDQDGDDSVQDTDAGDDDSASDDDSGD
jgi:hypothetical protein